MNVYLWESTDPVTGAGRSGGGILIVAATLDRARALWAEQNDALDAADWERLGDPDLAPPTAPDVAERVIVFPDTGCC